ncbi:PREDICTED: LRR receptor-like serine/threonine-protein kinase GSO1 [Prunus mume]|uniref:LRR receptor-like serine/threonine-protein kinase GSO1 n=1 Tax=Prunus mume TaxID=102107 RepID=A0ABM1LQT2_PRUMU|nr:PREDICTED: LRR receptor-like serine/threonine-protein kinase GSO1 [Prunus mume]
MQGRGRCFKLFLAFALLLLQYAQGGEMDHNKRDTNVTRRCIERERQALLAFKRGLVDKSDFLSSWGSEAQKQDCCRWVGVSCSNQTGHVLQLDLSDEVQSEFDKVQGKMISPKLIELHHLQHLALPRIDFNGSQFPYFIGSLTNLRYLDLSWTHFGGKFPSQVGNLTNLVYLDLRYNSFTNVENLDWLPRLSSLRYLDLSEANLSNVFDWPEVVNKLPELTNLTLKECDLPSPILSTLSYINSSKSLASVDLFYNRLNNSSIFVWLSNYSASLVHLDLYGNLLAGSIPDVFGNMSSLAHLYLSNNQLEGSLPNLTNLSSLEDLFLRNNQLSGVISGTHLSKLSKLRNLDLSSNSLVLDIHADWIPPFQLHSINLESCKMGPHFPKWLQTQKNISYLRIPNVGISDILPSWFWSLCLTVEYMDLARNQIRGAFPNLTLEFSYSPEQHLSSNKLEGPIPSVLSKASHLDLSNNKLSGSISFLCSSAAIGLFFLNLSSNNVSGQVPDCLTHLENLVMLDLSYNVLSGKIPTTIGYVFRIETLKLRSNRFVGQLPSSLKNCTSLVVIDVGLNKLSGQIPEWLGVSLKYLVILMLSSNHFNGSLPSQLCHLTHIQILDFSMNIISGSIPKCLTNLTTLAQKGNPSLNISHYYVISHRRWGKLYNDDATFMWKGGMQTYKSTLGLVKRIDLSSNKLTGEIPSEITQLVGLVSLNLSRNQLIGQITPEIGNLQSLDSLDVSRNHINGRIPTSLARIDRLGFLDLSYNNLSGKIPVGTQLQGFDPSFYVGNLQLCGPPLKKMCADEVEKGPRKHTDFINQEDKDELITLGFYISMGLGFVVGFWGVCGTLIFSRSWRYAYMKFLNGLNDWLFVRIALLKRQLKDA